jgi:branched-chain amino acid transport system permease protein
VNDYMLTVGVLFCVGVILAMSLNLVMGFGGIMSVQHGASMGIGAYTAGVLAVRYEFNTLWTVLAGALLAFLVSLAFMAVAVRLPGDDFILASFAFQMAVVDLFARWTSVTNGTIGLVGVDRPRFPGIDFVDNRTFVILVLAVTIVCGLIISYLARSGMGVTLRAIRESERSTEAAGRNVVYTKTVVFALASGFAGLAGGLYATLVGLISPMDFDMHRSILVIAFLLVGGVGNMRGAALGAVVLLTVPEMVARIDAIPSQYLGPVEQIIYGAIIVIFVWLRPVGLLPERPVVYMRPRSVLQRVVGDRVAGWIRRPAREGVAGVAAK